MPSENSGNPIGRPKKAKKKKIGRPLGEAGIMKQYRERMLNSPKSRKVLDAIFSAALDDEHRNQGAAWKLIMDRIVPIAGFEKETLGGSGRAQIQVNITGVPGVEVSSIGQNDPVSHLEGSFSEVEPKDE